MLEIGVDVGRGVGDNSHCWPRQVHAGAKKEQQVKKKLVNGERKNEDPEVSDTHQGRGLPATDVSMEGGAISSEHKRSIG